MGKGGGGSSSTSKYSGVASETTAAAPAVARDVSEDTDEAISDQQDARSRLQGIRSTYNRFAAAAEESNGTKTKLG